MNAEHADCAREVAELSRLLPVPAERDLLPGRQRILKEHLMTELRADRAARPAARTRLLRRPTPLPRRTLALAAGTGVLAAAVAATLAVAASQSGLSSVPGHTGAGRGGNVTAAQLLAKIAKVAGQPSTPVVGDSQFSYVRSWVAYQSCEATVSRSSGKVSSGTCVMPKPHERQIWLSVSDLCRPGLARENGSNATLTDPGARCPDRGSLGDATYRLLQSLPTNPRTLLHLIYTEEQGHGLTPDQEAFNIIGALLDETITPPKLSAALYRAAAMIPGVTVVSHAVDAVGRHGIAVAFTYRGTRSEWIFDPKTLQWLGQRDVTTATGRVVGESAVLARGFVNHPGQVPPAPGR
ncbi:MAG TPA: CU044_5270 family protein [Streptosporangiaceae bacterium]|nr:CU044_5270 family protein [Streptosporangiaceae bacterium]